MFKQCRSSILAGIKDNTGKPTRSLPPAYTTDNIVTTYTLILKTGATHRAGFRVVDSLPERNSFAITDPLPSTRSLQLYRCFLPANSRQHESVPRITAASSEQTVDNMKTYQPNLEVLLRFCKKSTCRSSSNTACCACQKESACRFTNALPYACQCYSETV